MNKNTVTVKDPNRVNSIGLTKAEMDEFFPGGSDPKNPEVPKKKKKSKFEHLHWYKGRYCKICGRSENKNIEDQL